METDATLPACQLASHAAIAPSSARVLCKEVCDLLLEALALRSVQSAGGAAEVVLLPARVASQSVLALPDPGGLDTERHTASLG